MTTNDPVTKKFVEHVQQVWYCDGCDVKMVSPNCVHVGLPPRIEISAFCADISQPPFNAVARLVNDADGVLAICDIHGGIVESTQHQIPWFAIFIILFVALLLGGRYVCGGIDECYEQLVFNPYSFNFTYP